jgi:hypothetical protein
MHSVMISEQDAPALARMGDARLRRAGRGLLRAAECGCLACRGGERCERARAEARRLLEQAQVRLYELEAAWQSVYGPEFAEVA